jgi:hypothetical protein
LPLGATSRDGGSHHGSPDLAHGWCPEFVSRAVRMSLASRAERHAIDQVAFNDAADGGSGDNQCFADTGDKVTARKTASDG